MQIILTQEVSDFIDEVTRLCKGEVGGVGYCTADEDGNVVVDHVFLLPQEVDSGSVEFAPDATAIAIERSYLDERAEDLRFSWHSHGELDTFWSNTDDSAIEKYLEGGAEWLVSLVVNRKGSRLGRIDVQGVALAGRAKFDKIKVTTAIQDRTEGRALAEVKANVTQIKRVWSSKGTGKAVKKDAKKDEKKLADKGYGAQMDRLLERDNAASKDGQWEDYYQQAMGLSPWEHDLLVSAGYEPSQMSQNEQDDALMEIQIARMAGS